MNEPSSPLIVGAGIAGIALAATLRRAGKACTLVDRRAEAPTGGTGIVLTGNAVAALATFGLEHEVLAAGRPFDEIEFSDDAGDVRFALQLGDRERWGRWVCIRRSRLHTILLRALGDAPVRWGQDLVALHEQDDAVEARWHDGRTTRHTLVVGADGVHSTVRELMFGAANHRLPEFTGWRFLSRAALGLERPRYLLGNGATFLLYPLPGGETYCGAGPVDARGVCGEGALAQLRGAFAGFGEPVRTALAALHTDADLLPTSYHAVDLPRWHSARIALIGDAAHACPPTLSVGAAMALEDAGVLGGLLAAAQDPRPALAQFEAARRPKVTLVQSAAAERMQANRRVDAGSYARRMSILEKFGAEQVANTWIRFASPHA